MMGPTTLTNGARPAPLPFNEVERLEVLRSLCILDTPQEPVFEELTALAGKLFNAPIVLISLIDEHRQFFKSAVGLSVNETSRDLSFCAYALLTDEPLVVPDASKDERFCTHPAVTGEPFIRFYAGAPLVAGGGLKLGTFCIADREPRQKFSQEDYRELTRFALLTTTLIEQRLLPERVATAEHKNDLLERHLREILESTTDSVVLLDRDFRITYLNQKANDCLSGGRDILGASYAEVFPETEKTSAGWDALRKACQQKIATSFEDKGLREQLSEFYVYPAPEGVAIFFRDVTQRRKMELELRNAHERFALATRATTDGIWDLDCGSGIVYYSARWRAMLGLPEEEAFGSWKDWSDRIYAPDLERLGASWRQMEANPECSLEAEFRCRHEDGSWRWILSRAVCQRDKKGKVVRVTGAASDITSRKVLDPLTGLHNRTSLIEQLQLRIDKQEHDGNNYALFFIDMDFFKRINDSLGHITGDGLLIEVGRRLEDTVKDAPGSIAGRLGGDEFVVLISDVGTECDALAYASTLEGLLKLPVACAGQKVSITASIGVAFAYPGLYSQPEQILEDADLAMYRAKLNGKAQNALFSPAMREKALARLNLETDLRTALQEGQLEVYYQPQVKLATGQLEGFEALARWRHPERGMVSPAEFIPISEETGLISEIGRWVAAEALEQLANWRSRGLVNSTATMAVNVSTKQFSEPDLLHFFCTQMRKFGIPDHCLVLEVTESIFLADSTATLALLESIVSAGIGLDLDDFGTGYSSLSYLHRYPFRSVKIDRSFIGRMTDDPKSIELVASVVQLAASLKMEVVAEGVETEEQAEQLRWMKCPSAQGYLFSAPKPANQLEEMLSAALDPSHASLSRSWQNQIAENRTSIASANAL